MSFFGWKTFEEIYPKLRENCLRWKTYQHNSKISVEGFIEKGQGNSPVCELRLSKCSFGKVGCEVIASYNFLKFAGKECSLAKLGTEFEKNALILPFGVWGSNPLKIGGMLTAHGVDFQQLFKLEECACAFENCRSMIVSFHIGKCRLSGIHTVFVLAENGKHYVFNRSDGSQGRSEISSIYQIVKGQGTFITAYCLADGGY